MENEHLVPRCGLLVDVRTDGIANSESAPNAIHFTAPPQFGGLEGSCGRHGRTCRRTDSFCSITTRSSERM
jgi:hypothetical protein